MHAHSGFIGTWRVFAYDASETAVLTTSIVNPMLIDMDSTAVLGSMTLAGAVARCEQDSVQSSLMGTGSIPVLPYE